MRRAPLLALLVTLAAVALSGPALAGEPPNGSDPCSSAGRDTCGTTGIGFYQTYRYGIRWFGDYRGSIPGEAHTFCIDLRYWYPSKAYRYEEQTGVLRNRADEVVPVLKQHKLAYAIWTYGRSTDPKQQAAVMLYVHTLMGDGRPGETDPAALGQALATFYARIAGEATRLHGPYRIEARLPDRVALGRPAIATIRVLSAAGNPVPNVRLRLAASGASGVPRELETGPGGSTQLELTATSARKVQLTVQAGLLASTLPRIFRAAPAAPARYGQRLAAPAQQTVTASFTTTAARAHLTATTAATPARLAVGGITRDTITIAGALSSYQGNVVVRIYGPFRSLGEVRCSDKPAWEGTFVAHGSGAFLTPPVKVERPGWYTYREVVHGDANHIGLTTPCAEAAESFRVEAQPQVRTVVSEQRVAPGSPIYDRIRVTGLAGETATVLALLYGPFPSRDAIGCDGAPIWSGSVQAAGDGEYRTMPFTLTVPGFYAYREQIAGSELVRATATECGDVSETSVAFGSPKVTTQVSSQEAKVGASISDRVVVSGLGGLSAPVRVELWGPFASRSGVRCSGKPYWTGIIVAKGDGTYTTVPVQLQRAGYYTYHETIAKGEASTGASTGCGEAAETTIARPQPLVTTLASNEVVFPGAAISDTIRVQGLGRTPAIVRVELYGPFASRDAIVCTGRPYWKGGVTVPGDGVFRSPQVRLATAGFYTYHERLIGSGLVPEVTTDCGVAEETSLGRPLIITGRGEKTRAVRVRDAGGATPRRVRLASLGIDAPVFASGIDLRQGVLAVPPSIHQAGWWRDGAAPGATSGSILIAGHVDSATAGPGAFFALKSAKAGATVQVSTADGRTFSYRVVSVRNYPKRELPADIYSLRGPPRLVLVTCGGLFDEAKGRYRDNIVLTAVPA